MATYRKGRAGRIPAYLSYSSWLKLLEALEKYTPPRFDRSYWNGLKFSGSTAMTARSTLIFLELIGVDGIPTDELQPLVDSKGDERRIQLKTIMERAYTPIIGDLKLLERATPGQVEELFRNAGAKGEIGDRSIYFLLALAKDAGLTLSPLLEDKFRTRRTPKTTVTRTRGKRNKKEKAEEQTSQEILHGISWISLLEELLLEEFPGFDSSWSDDVKIKWLFRELRRRTKSD